MGGAGKGRAEARVKAAAERGSKGELGAEPLLRRASSAAEERGPPLRRLRSSFSVPLLPWGTATACLTSCCGVGLLAAPSGVGGGGASLSRLRARALALARGGVGGGLRSSCAREEGWKGGRKGEGCAEQDGGAS